MCVSDKADKHRVLRAGEAGSEEIIKRPGVETLHLVSLVQ